MGDSLPLLTEDEIVEKTANLIVEESSNPDAWWWLSFVDPDLPVGTQFLGACIIKARGFISATVRARALGCNPGGECHGIGPIPVETVLPEGYAERLLTRAECEEFDRIMLSKELP